MGKNKVLVKVHPEGKYVVDVDKDIDISKLTVGVRVALRNDSYQLHLLLPTKVDPLVSLMKVEKVPDSTYDMIGGCDQQIKEIKEVSEGEGGGEGGISILSAWLMSRRMLCMQALASFQKNTWLLSSLLGTFSWPRLSCILVLCRPPQVIELPLTHPELFESLGISQPKGVLLYGPPGTGKTLLARAVAHHTDCTFIRVSGSELVQKYIGEGSRMVRELFVMAR